MGSNPLPLLRTTPLFRACSTEDLSEIADVSEFVEFADGTEVFRPGDSSDRLFIVHGGQVVIRKDDDEGHPVDIARYLPGDCFGDVDMFTDSSRNASAITDGKVSLLLFPRAGIRFGQISTISAGVRAHLLHSFLVQVSSRIRGANAMVRENSPIVEELRRQVYVDKLTNLFNRTRFDEVLAGLITSDNNVGLLLYKPDNFKLINDRHGHDAGDRVLRFIADKLREFVDDRDMLFRYMGNENAYILPDCTRETLWELAHRLGQFLRSLSFSGILNGDDIPLSVSFGLGIYPEHAVDAAGLSEIVHPLTLVGRRLGGNRCLFPEDVE